MTESFDISAAALALAGRAKAPVATWFAVVPGEVQL
jgi:hypothetical protein